MTWWMWMILGAYVTMSVVTFVVYAVDKRRARRGEWRVPEKSLHLLALLGGWPGALLAMRIVHHKGSKAWFVVTTWMIVLVHVAAWGWWIWQR